MQEIVCKILVCKILFDYISFITKKNYKLIKPKMGVNLHNMSENLVSSYLYP